MIYTISYTHAFNKTSEQWTGSFGEAKVLVVQCVEAGVAEYVEIRDSRGNPAYQYPARKLSPVSIIEPLTRPPEHILDTGVRNDSIDAVSAAQPPSII